MPALFPILIVLLAGVGLAVQPPTNAALAKASGSVWLASLVSFAMGTAVLFAIWAAADRTMPSTLKGAPSWAWLGGLYGACFVAALAYASPRLGLASALTIAVGSQLVTALVLDRFGLLGLSAQPISLMRVGGVVLVIGGVLLVRAG
ncbi:transporter family-2 protein [Sphingomonas sp. PP-F2F-G114-C0414]|uniref:DMT family transporter n=1 Tax=Sphingomonas sp. PP-F2F-G114-C0414 TaxID=2135662 RepID=UPI000EF881F3|nr:DMT family transporter [Sphingomonas sp. PP-F2F-G114-C0414]RMB36057.1 transporter family-2 protein [Sphingomonas sp. PP-F2F-G114-C0414]